MQVGDLMLGLEGFDEFIDMCSDMQISDEDVYLTMKKALNAPKNEAKRNAPILSGRTKSAIKVKLKRDAFGGVIGIVLVDDFRAMFQEFMNTRQKGAHVGWFERSINKTESEVVDTLKKELLDSKVK